MTLVSRHRSSYVNVMQHWTNLNHLKISIRITYKIHYLLHLHAINSNTVRFKHDPRNQTLYQPPPTRVPSNHSNDPKEYRAPKTKGGSLRSPNDPILFSEWSVKCIARISPGFVIERFRPTRRSLLSIFVPGWRTRENSSVLLPRTYICIRCSEHCQTGPEGSR